MEPEFTVTEKVNNSGKKFNVVRPIYDQGQSPYGRQQKKEQSRYSGFSDSYIKDMLISGVLEPEVDSDTEKRNDIIMMTWKKRAFEVFEHMVQLDKTLQS